MAGAQSMIDEAIAAGADRLLVVMLELRHREAQEEAQQTLDYFGVDGTVGRCACCGLATFDVPAPQWPKYRTQSDVNG